MNRALLIPIVALLALTIKHLFNVELSQTDMDTIVEGLLAVLSLVGIFMHPKKGGGKNEVEQSVPDHKDPSDEA